MSNDNTDISKRRRGLVAGIGGLVTVSVLGSVGSDAFGSNAAVYRSAAVTDASADGDAPPIEWIRGYDQHDEQTTTATAGGERTGFASVVTTDDGGYALAGYETPPNAGRNALLLKTDEEGLQQWERSYGGSDVDEAASLIQTTDGGYLLVGEHGNPKGEERTAAGPRSTGWAIKTDATGVVDWTVKPDNSTHSHLRDATQTRDGGYALAGFVQENGPEGDLQGWVVKLNRNGRPIVDQRYDSTDDDPQAVEEQFWSVTETGQGDLVFAGENKDGAWVLRTTPAGKRRWETVIPYPHAAAHDVVETGDGTLLITGRLYERTETTTFTMTDDRNPSDLYLTLLNADGTVQWTKSYDGGANETGNAVVHTADGGFAAVGGSLGPSDDVFVAKTEHDGTAAWSDTYLQDLSRVGADLVQSPDGGFAVAVSHSDVFFKVSSEMSPSSR